MTSTELLAVLVVLVVLTILHARIGRYTRDSSDSIFLSKRKRRHPADTAHRSLNL